MFTHKHTELWMEGKDIIKYRHRFATKENALGVRKFTDIFSFQGHRSQGYTIMSNRTTKLLNHGRTRCNLPSSMKVWPNCCKMTPLWGTTLWWAARQRPRCILCLFKVIRRISQIYVQPFREAGRVVSQVNAVKIVKSDIVFLNCELSVKWFYLVESRVCWTCFNSESILKIFFYWYYHLYMCICKFS